MKLLHVLFCGPNLRTPPISSQLSSYYAGIICSVLPAANYYASIIYAGLPIMLYKLVIPKYGPLLVSSVLPPFMDIICYVPPSAYAFRKHLVIMANNIIMNSKTGQFVF